MIRATVLAIADELTVDGLVLRYRPDETDDGFTGEEGTFTICSFWLVSALSEIGETKRAHELCAKLLSFAGPLELYAEEIDHHTGRHLGNFPQAFTHWPSSTPSCTSSLPSRRQTRTCDGPRRRTGQQSQGRSGRHTPSTKRQVEIRGTVGARQVDSRGMAAGVVPDDQALLEALADGDLGALSQLYDRHAPWLSVRLTRRCNDREVVADVLQDTFVAVWQGAGRYQGRGEVGAWMWGIAIRRLVSRLRTRRDVVLMGNPVLMGSSTASGVPALVVEDELLQGVEYGDLGHAMASLSPEMRAVIQATVLDGLTTREASRLLGSPRARSRRGPTAPRRTCAPAFWKDVDHEHAPRVARGPPAWVSGAADGLVSASVEQHVVHCAACQAAVARELGTPRTSPTSGIRPRRDRAAAAIGPRAGPRPTRPAAGGRDARRLGPGAARLVDLRRGARRRLRPRRGVAARTGYITLFLTVAPLAPVLAVATAFGPEGGAALEQESAAPYPLVRLVLLRTGAVLLTALPVVLVGQLFFPELAAWVWLLPALGFTAAVLGLSTWFGPWRPATVITAVWVVGTAAANRLDTVWAVFAPRYVVLYLLMLVLGPLVLVLRARRLGTIGRISP